MKKWKAHAQVNGPEYTSIDNYEFDVPDYLYEEAMGLIKAGKCLSGTETEKKLEELADAALDFESMCPDFDEEEPDRDDFDTEEEYKEAVEEYEEEKESHYDDFFLEALSVYDPGEFLRFKDKIIGLKTGFAEGTNEWEGEYETSDWFMVNYRFSYKVDADGIITDVDEAYAETCVGEDVKASYWDETEPDYDRIFEQVLESIEDCEEE